MPTYLFDVTYAVTAEDSEAALARLTEVLTDFEHVELVSFDGGEEEE